MVDANRSSSGLVDRIGERDVLERLVAGLRAGPGRGLGLRGEAGGRDVLERLVAGVGAGQSGVLVLRGEAGVGKTALLRHLSAAASGFRIARAAGVESEMELAYAGLHALCAPMLGRLEQLPEPQRGALRTPVGPSARPRPDRFLGGLAGLSPRGHAAPGQPPPIMVD